MSIRSFPKRDSPAAGLRRGRPLLLAAALLAGGCGTAARAPETPAAPGTGPQVRVGLMVDTTFAELLSANGLELVDPGSGRTLARSPAGEPVRITSDAEGRLEYRLGNAAARRTRLRLITARPGAGGIVSIGGKPYRGAAVIQANGPGRVTAINRVDMETYLLGVVPREIGRVGPELLEAAKAQAVAARTYAMVYMGRREALGFDVFATVQDQVYGGVEAEHETVSRAIRETAGQILTHDGEPIQAYYSSTCGGRTSTIHEVWPVEPPRPYLVTVSDVNPATGEAYCSTSNRFRWTERWTARELTDILNRTLADSLPPGAGPVGALRDLEVRERTSSGRIRAIAVVTDAHTLVVGGDRIRWIFLRPNGVPLNSSRFDARVTKDDQGRPVEVVAEGGGWGHGIGMCQVGAMGRARAGQDYRAILGAYYTGARIHQLY